MKLITKEIRTKLEANANKTEISGDDDHRPVVKLFNPAGAATWLLTEIEDDIAFGLCDLGMGSPELGSVSITELEAVKGPMGLGIERDQYFTASNTISEYAAASRSAGYITAPSKTLADIPEPTNQQKADAVKAFLAECEGSQIL
jgi:hypothetical protein